MRAIAVDQEVFVTNVVDVDVVVVVVKNAQSGKVEAVIEALELCERLFEVVGVNVCVAEHHDEFVRHAVWDDVCDQVGQQGVTGDVERNAQEEVGGALVHGAGQQPLG